MLIFAALCLVGLAFLALAAAYLDVISFTLPNWLTASIAVLFFTFVTAMYFAGSLRLSEIGIAVAAGAGVFALGVGLFVIGAVGGGDVKYLGAATLWATPVGPGEFLFLTSIVGALVALVYLVASKLHGLATGPDAKHAAQQSGFARPMPYGVAISGGLVLVIWRWAARLFA